jgi:hypothetical protein
MLQGGGKIDVKESKERALAFFALLSFSSKA